MNPLLSVSCLAIGHDGILQKNLDFKILEGDFLLVKGSNGTGKSTLLKTVMGEIKPLKGDLYWGMDRSKCSYLPQLLNYDFPFSITLGEILDSFSLRKEAFEISLPYWRCWSDASGGEKQKTLLLSRLQKTGEFLILDEPFNHMDKKNILEMSSLMALLLKKKILKGVFMTGHISLKRDDLSVIKELELL